MSLLVLTGCAIHAPVLWRKQGTLNPLALCVINQISEGLGLSLKSEALEHWWDFVVGQEGQGHQFPYVSVDSIGPSS